MVGLAGNLAGNLSGAGAGAPPIDQPSDIVSAGELVEWWAARLGRTMVGSDVDIWTGQKVGIELFAPTSGQRPPYAVDGAHFSGLPVLQCATATAKCLITGTLGADIWDPSDHAYAIVGLRYRTALLAISPTWALSLRPSFGAGSVLLNIQPGSVNATLRCDGVNGGTSSDVACDTNGHSVETWLDAATGDMLSVDGTDSTGSGGTATPGSNKSFSIGSLEGIFASDVSISGVVLLRNKPSVGVRAALRAWLFQEGGAL